MHRIVFFRYPLISTFLFRIAMKMKLLKRNHPFRLRQQSRKYTTQKNKNRQRTNLICKTLLVQVTFAFLFYVFSGWRIPYFRSSLYYMLIVALISGCDCKSVTQPAGVQNFSICRLFSLIVILWWLKEFRIATDSCFKF